MYVTTLAIIVFSVKLYTLHGSSSKYFALKNHRQVVPAACLLDCAYPCACSLQECSFPVKCSIEMLVFREFQHAMLCLVLIPDDRHLPASLDWLLVQVNSSQIRCVWISSSCSSSWSLISTLTGRIASSWLQQTKSNPTLYFNLTGRILMARCPWFNLSTVWLLLLVHG